MKKDNVKSVPQEHSDSSPQNEDSANTTTYAENLIQRLRERMRKDLKEQEERMDKIIEESVREMMEPTAKVFQGIMPLINSMAEYQKNPKQTEEEALKRLQESIERSTEAVRKERENRGVTINVPKPPRIYDEIDPDLMSEDWETIVNPFSKERMDEKNILQFLENAKSLPAKRLCSKDYLRRLARRHGLSAPLADAVVRLLVLNRTSVFSRTLSQKGQEDCLDSFRKTFGYVAYNAIQTGMRKVRIYRNSPPKGKSETD